MDETHDVVVIGGGAAGLSGALALAQSGRSVLVIDDGRPRNAPAWQVHNYLTRDGTRPAEMIAAGRDEVIRYGGAITTGRVETVTKHGDRFLVLLNNGGTYLARRLLVATGLIDELPDLPGIAERWGRDVLHCPYCHGWQVRNRRIGVLATGPMATRQVHAWRQLSPHVMLLLHSVPTPNAQDAERLAAREITVVNGPVAQLMVTGDVLTGIRLASGEVVMLDAVVVASRKIARAEMLEPLGLTPADLEVDGHLVASSIPAEATGATAVPGVWVAGNVTNAHAHTITAAAQGLNAAAAINADLIAEDTSTAVENRRHQVLTKLEYYD